MNSRNAVTRRRALSAGLATVTSPIILKSSVHGAAPNEKIVMAAIGVGGRGRSDLRNFLDFQQVHVVAVCDVVGRHAKLAKQMVDQKYNNSDCQVVEDFREITHRDDIDAVLIATPDHWHAIISIDAMLHGKDVFCEKPETLTINEGKRMVQIARRYGRVFSGGSQRVWGDYHWFHRMVRGGAIGDIQQAWVNVGGPSGPCYLPPQETPTDVNWDLWLGPAPERPFHNSLIRGGFRPFRDYSGGGTTDWGCHGFGGALFACEVHETGPVEVRPSGGSSGAMATVIWENGLQIHHGGGTAGILAFEGTEGHIDGNSPRESKHQAPDIHIPNYQGSGGIFGDFLHCVKTREQPFRDIERAHRTATVCHLLNIAYWLGRPIKWDPHEQQIIGDAEAARWMDRPNRQPWSVA